MFKYSLTVSWLAPLMRAVESLGIDPQRVLAGELNAEDLDTPANARIDHDAMTRLWRRAVAVTREPTIGLIAGGFVGPNSFGALSFAMYASENALTALRTLVRFNQVVSNAATWSYRQTDTYVEVTQQMRGPIGADEQKDANAAAILHMCRGLGDPTLRFERLKLGRRRPGRVADWRNALSVEPVFNGNGITSMRFSLAAVSQRCATYEPEMFEFASALLESRLKQVGSDSFLATVSSSIIEALEHGDASIDAVAGRMGISRRTLQRRLWTESHYTYSSLLQMVRHSLAKRYLAGSSRSIDEISSLLGYANLSSFSRSFRRIDGLSPSAFRRQTGRGDLEVLEPVGPV